MTVVFGTFVFDTFVFGTFALDFICFDCIISKTAFAVGVTLVLVFSTVTAVSKG